MPSLEKENRRQGKVIQPPPLKLGPLPEPKLGIVSYGVPYSGALPYRPKHNVHHRLAARLARGSRRK